MKSSIQSFCKKGAVEIVHYVPELKRVNRVAILPPGSHFAEFSVLNNSAKSASAFAFEDCELMAISGSKFYGILKKLPVIPKQLAQTLGKINFKISESHSSIEDYRQFEPEYSREILSLLPVTTWERMKILPLKYAGGMLSVAMTQPQDLTTYERIKTMLPSTELLVSVIAESDFSEAYIKIRNLYESQRIISNQVRQSRTKKGAPQFDMKTFLQGTHLFRSVHEQILDQIIPYIKVIEYSDAEYVFKSGDVCENLNIVLDGSVLISKSITNLPAHVHVVDCGPGEAFSTIPVLLNENHIHSAKSIESTRVAKIPKLVVHELLKVPEFSIALASDLANRLQVMNNKHGLSIYEGSESLDLSPLANLLPISIIESYQVLPLILNDDELTVGIVSSENETIYSVIARYLLDYRIKIVLITQQQFKRWASQAKSSLSSTQNNSRTVSTNMGATSPKLNIVATSENSQEVYQEILSEGFLKNASDVHIEPSESVYTIRYRIDGILVERPKKISKQIGLEIINKIKVNSKIDITERALPQDGQLSETVGGQPMKARVSTMPTKHGENAVLRLIRQKNAIIPLNMLAPDRRTINIFKQITQFKQGLFLITGPTGSGKTTSLYSMLNELNRVDINVITLENPVEMQIDGITQIEMDEKRGLTFGKALRGVLRQDPDVVMVGEIRDEESAQIVFHAAMTGHLVFSTLHTNNSMEVFHRLQELGISPSTISAGLIGSVAQRLLRATCRHCKRSIPISPSEKATIERELGVSAPAELKVGVGCTHCSGSGYSGRIPVYEIWRKTNDMRTALENNCTTPELISAARADDFLTLREFGLKMVIYGLTTIDEVNRCLNEI
ncbi:MAG: ATPase, T2SS/T4P/T4SS family [Bdellovibrionales bacterium]